MWRMLFACVLWILLVLFIGACSDPPSESNTNVDEAVSAEEALTGQGVEKVIPLRIVNLLDCIPTSSGCLWKDRYNDVLRQIDVANQSYYPAGIQFRLKSFEGYYAPSFTNLTSWDYPQQSWTTARTQLGPIVPMPSSEWQPGVYKSGTEWLRAVGTAVAARDNPEEFIVWITQETPDGASYGWIPEAGRMVVLNRAHLSWNNTTLAHELGHAFGLWHTWEVPNTPDPQTQASHSLWDMWDLVYKPGEAISIIGQPEVVHKFFVNRADAAKYPVSELSVINTRINDTSNCTTTVFGGSVSCTIRQCSNAMLCRSETHSTGSAALKGLGFPYSSTPYGNNLMSYDDTFLGFALNFPRSLSASQIQRLLKYMRFAVPINDAYLQPPHVTFSANLPLLGSGHTRQVAADMDFDCDGKRDIAVWEPPTAPGQTGTFRVWLSSKGFSNSAGQFVSRSFGQLGDIPVVAAMSGGCATDLAIFQPGGGLARNDPTDTQGYWQICYTGSNPLSQTCSGTSLIAFGDREDIPLPGLKFGTGTTRYLSVFRQRSSEWLWRSVSSSSVSSRQFTGTGLVPLPGLYDEDDLTDLAVFEPSTATFVMLMSNYNWNLIVSRVFSGDFVPQPNGTQLQRSGAIPLAGMNRIALLPSGSPTFPFLIGNRRVLSLYGPTNRTWATMWDPVGSGTIDTCNYGTNSLDIPISGIDINGDRNSDMVYFTSTNGATGTIYFKNSTPSSPNACNGSTISKSVSLSNWRKTKVFVVSDITGDGKPEILLFDPEAMNVRWLTSESGYTSYGSTTINVGGPRAILL